MRTRTTRALSPAPYLFSFRPTAQGSLLTAFLTELWAVELNYGWVSGFEGRRMCVSKKMISLVPLHRFSILCESTWSLTMIQESNAKSVELSFKRAKCRAYMQWHKSVSLCAIQLLRWTLLCQDNERQKICDNDGPVPDQVWKFNKWNSICGAAVIWHNLGHGNSNWLR